MLLCDDLGPRIDAIGGEYTDLYRRLVESADPDGDRVDMVPFRAHDGIVPTAHDLASFDAVMIGGSKAGVYEDHPWLQPLFAAVRTAIDSHIPTIGICFGHQVVATALGASVTPFEGGWNLSGVDYRFVDASHQHESEVRDSIRLIAFHQDQVREVPVGTRRFLTADRCEIAGLVGDAILTMQPHPEFSSEVARAILESGRGRRFSDAEIDDALSRVDRPLDADVAARLIRSVIERRSALV
jgi:GMP synthase-like glutamine amidotransferase